MMVLSDNTVSRPSPANITLAVVPKRTPMPKLIAESAARARHVRLVAA